VNASRERLAARRRGFTLAEVAVTIAVVGLALVWMLQALNAAKVTAAYTRNLKLARELSLLTLGQIEAGLFEDDLGDERVDGTYAEEGYPDFAYEIVVGDENFRPLEQGEAFDNWLEEQIQKDDDDEEDLAEQAYEKVQIRVTFPPIQDLKSELVLERWLPWAQVHPPEEGEQTAAGDAGAPPGAPE
jgi:prepilin-type N-terminal cleavage/methylation domain-containing protein